MRIPSLRQSFEADHSSSMYEFFALDRLTPAQRGAIRDLTKESGRRHLRLHYGGEGSIPDGWTDELLTLGYDIMVSESYDWWSVYLSLPHDPDRLERLQLYTCESDSNGFDISVVGESMILDFGMQLGYGAAYGEFGEEPFEGLANLIERVREELQAGDLSAPWAMYSIYGGDDDHEPDPIEPLSASGETLLRIMERY